LLVEEHGAADLDLDRPVRHRNVERIAHSVAAASYKGQRDGTSAIFGPVARRHMADHFHRDRLVRIFDDLRALIQDQLGVLRLEADKLLASLGHEIRSLKSTNAHEVGLLLAYGPVQSDIIRRYRAVRILPDDDVALLRAQNVHRFRAIGASTMLLPFGPERLPNGLSIIGRDVDLEATLAGERHAEKPGRHAADLAFTHRHMWHRLIGDVDALHQRRDDVAALRPLHRYHRPLLGNGSEPHLEMGELGLEIVLHHVQHARRAAGRRGDMEPVLGEATDHAIVINVAVFAQHHALAAPARLQLLPGLGVHELHECGGVWPHHLDLAERGSVKHAGGFAHRHAFAIARSMHVLAGTREVPGALPLSDILEHRTL